MDSKAQGLQDQPKKLHESVNLKPSSQFVGISPFAMETAQRHLKKTKASKSKPSGWMLLCYILFVITAFNTLLSIKLIFQNVQLIEENTGILADNRKLLDKLSEVRKIQEEQDSRLNLLGLLGSSWSWSLIDKDANELLLDQQTDEASISKPEEDYSPMMSDDWLQISKSLENIDLSDEEDTPKNNTEKS